MIVVKRDFSGKPLNIGDEVAFMQVGYRNLMRGTIVSMSEKKALIKHEKTNWSQTETRQLFEQIVKIS